MFSIIHKARVKHSFPSEFDACSVELVHAFIGLEHLEYRVVAIRSAPGPLDGVDVLGLGYRRTKPIGWAESVDGLDVVSQSVLSRQRKAFVTDADVGEDLAKLVKFGQGTLHGT
jgi:hypothetical protein